MSFFRSVEEAQLHVWMVSACPSSFFLPAPCPACSSTGSSHGTSAWPYQRGTSGKRREEKEAGVCMSLGFACSQSLRFALALSQGTVPLGGPFPPASAPPPGSSSRPLQPRRGRKTPRVLHCPGGFSLNPAYTFTNTSVMGNLMLST